ncbi:hypothetical protein H3S80_05880 [Bartonella sp. M0177]|uniref:hypothetical protein n=1 Tax=Bartonella sp. M0177 TaxID=2750940 RepID=UPI0018DD382D|nr:MULTISPECIES: hypothetical protein [Bartonella]MBI0003582.1 hypothetical protein [Bartonella sp. M0177]WLT09505.1 hypothetical protein RAM19_04990 [Bartonella apihabitans]
MIVHVRDVTIDWLICGYRKPESGAVPEMDGIMAMILLDIPVLVFIGKKTVFYKNFQYGENR